MIDTELENESVILKFETFNAEPAFSKPVATGGRSIFGF